MRADGSTASPDIVSVKSNVSPDSDIRYFYYLTRAVCLMNLGSTLCSARCRPSDDQAVRLVVCPGGHLHDTYGPVSDHRVPWLRRSTERPEKQRALMLIAAFQRSVPRSSSRTTAEKPSCVVGIPVNPTRTHTPYRKPARDMGNYVSVRGLIS